MKVNKKVGNILVVGRSFKSINAYLKAAGYNYTILRDAATASHPDKQIPNRVLADFGSKASILRAVDNLTQPPDAILTIYENYILAGAWIADHLGIPGISETAAKACTDKELMRECFSKARRQISPDFKVVENEKELVDFANSHSYPLILKPANLAKSLLVHKCHNETELRRNYRDTQRSIAQVYAKYAPRSTPKLLVEEFLEGSIHSVDAFIDARGNPHIMQEIVDYQTGYDIGYDDNFHYSRLLPSKLSKAQQANLRNVAKLGCQALGLISCPAHIEIIMTKAGPRIVEIAARNGGYRERMYALSSGIDIPGNALRLAMDKPLRLSAQKNDSVAVLELFPKVSGHFLKLANEAALKKLGSLKYVSIKAHTGQHVGSSSTGHKAVAVIILHNLNNAHFDKDLAFVNKYVYVETDGNIS